MHTRLSVLSVVLCASFASAQDMDTSPAKEVQKFAPLIGSWEGDGLVRHAAAGPSEKWTAKASTGWALNGHFVREELRIEFESMPNPLKFTNYYGWDKENERYVVIEVSNLGTAKVQELHWDGDDKLLSTKSSTMMGQLIVERWVTEIGDGVIKFAGHQSQGAGEFFEQVTGSMKRTDRKQQEIATVEAAFAPDMVGPLAKKIGKLTKVCGTYEMTGWFSMAPDMPKMDITGTETARSIFDGSLIEMRMKGQPMNYEGLSWFSWDDHDGCYKMTYCNNMGEVATQDCRIMGNKLVFTQSTMYMGQPTCSRGVLTLGDDGSFKSFSSHVMQADQDPRENFGATYKKVN